MSFLNLFSKGKAQEVVVQLRLTDADYCPDDLQAQLPLNIDVLRQMPGPDTPNYWLAKCEVPIHWNERGCDIYYLVVGCRLVGAEMKKGIGHIALNVAYVIDESLLKDRKTDLSKCAYVAICMANEIG